MINLYHKISRETSKNITQLYSTSFSFGIKLLDKSIHDAIYSIYGFVRLADEIVDTFHDYPKTEMLSEFKEETYKSIDRKISVNPVLHSFQMVVNQYSIDIELIEILENMERSYLGFGHAHKMFIFRPARRSPPAAQLCPGASAGFYRGPLPDTLLIAC